MSSFGPISPVVIVYKAKLELVQMLWIITRTLLPQSLLAASDNVPDALICRTYVISLQAQRRKHFRKLFCCSLQGSGWIGRYPITGAVRHLFTIHRMNYFLAFSKAGLGAVTLWGLPITRCCNRCSSACGQYPGLDGALPHLFSCLVSLTD